MEPARVQGDGVPVGPPRRLRSRVVVIVGITIGVLTTLLGCMSFAFAITGEGEVLLVGWLSLVWGFAPVVAGVAALRSLRAAAMIAAIPVALGLVLTGYLMRDGDVGGAATLGAIATVPPAMLLANCLWILRGARS